MAKTLEARRIARTHAAYVRDLLRVAIAAVPLAAGALPPPSIDGLDDSDTVQAAAPSAPASSGDRLLGDIVSQFGRAELDRGGWINPYVPSAAAGNPIATVAVGEGVTLGRAGQPPQERESGDELLTRAVAQYTREMLDRGGWENPYVADGRCAAGNPLLAVRVGEGVTLLAAESEPTSVGSWQQAAAGKQ